MMHLRFTSSDNVKLTQLEIEKCHSIADQIKRLDIQKSSEKEWLSVEHVPVYGGKNIYNINLDENFLNHMREFCHFFTGYSLNNLNEFDGRIPTTDASVLWENSANWILETYKDYIEGVPKEIIYSPPLRFGEYGFNVNGVCVNPDTISYQERLILLYGFGIFDRLRKIDNPTIIEIGGGYGALAHAIMTRLPTARYIIVDLPSSLLFSACYLSISFPNLPITITDDISRICRSDFTGLAFLPDYAIAGNNIPCADLGINTLSFAEMPESVVESYASYLFRALKGRNGVLFEQNFGSNSHGKTFCDPEIILKRFFDFQLRCRAKTRWGRASLWGTESYFNQDLAWPPSMLGVLGQREGR